MRITDPELLDATARLLQNTDFQKLFAAMGAHAEELNKKLVMQPEMSSGDLHNLRGQTKVLVLLMEAITAVPDTLDKLSQPKK